MTTQPAPNEVTAEDREAYLSMNMLPEFDAADVRAGLWDKVTGIQAFARHRLTQSAADRAEIERLRAALTNLLLYAEAACEQIESEWGSCRSLSELEADGDMPHEIIAARQAPEPKP